MFHGPAADCGPDHAVAYKTRFGIIMFVIYSLIFIGFVAINVAKPSLMAIPVIFGLNLAVVYGVGLIVFALILALIYNHGCTKQERIAKAAHEAKENE